MRCSKSGESDNSSFHRPCLSFLMEGYCVREKNSLTMHKHDHIMDCGGLWKVNENVWQYFKL